ncbi:hypothetical protein AMTRI_Chr09g42900 [Amborella trichopoda]
MRNFLWSGQTEKKKYHLVAWDKVCHTKNQGGLGIEVLRKHNLALLGKWWWCLASQPNALWAQVLRHKYKVPEDTWLLERSQAYNVSGAWKSFSAVLATFKRYIRFHPREGSRVKFWQDLWLGPSPLREAFPNLYFLARDQDSSIAQELSISGGRRVWNPSSKEPRR